MFQPFSLKGPATGAVGTDFHLPLRIIDRNQGEIARTRYEPVRNQVTNDVETALPPTAPAASASSSTRGPRGGR